MLFKKQKKQFVPGILMGIAAGIALSAVACVLCDKKKFNCMCNGMKRMLTSVGMTKK